MSRTSMTMSRRTAALLSFVALLLAVAPATARSEPKPKPAGGKKVPAAAAENGDCINLALLAKEKAKELGADLSTIEELLEEAIGEEDMAIVKEALEGAGPDEKVATVFAPSDKAIKAALKKLGVTKDDLKANKPLLGQILKFHIVPGKALMAADLAKMDGEPLVTALDDSELEVMVDGKKVKIMPAGGDDASAVTVTKPDVKTCHAVVHVIDGVLLPPDLDLEGAAAAGGGGAEDGDAAAADAEGAGAGDAEGDEGAAAGGDDAADGAAAKPKDDDAAAAAAGGAAKPEDNDAAAGGDDAAADADADADADAAKPADAGN